MATALIAGLLAGWAIAIPVGAIGAYLVGLTAQTSLAVGVAAALGVATVDGGYAAIAVFGGRSLADGLRSIATPLRIIAAAALLVVAARAAWTAIHQHRIDAPTAVPRLRPSHAYRRLVALTALNPATVIYFVALVIGSKKLSQLSITEGVVFAAAAFAASASWQLSLAGGGAALGRVLTGPRGRLITALGSATVITVFAVVLLAQAA